MKPGNHLSNMRFAIRKLGTVTKGELTLKPLTLLCGGNNTGKTWAMYAMYGFLQQLPILALNPAQLGLAEWDQQLHANGVLSFDLAAWVQEYRTQIIQTIHDAMKLRLPEIFSGNPALFEQSNFEWIGDTDEMLASAIGRPIEFHLDLGNQGKAFLKIYKAAHEKAITVTLSEPALHDSDNYLANTLLAHLMQKEEYKNVFLLPAERNGLHLFFHELRNQRSARLHQKSNQDIPISAYAEPIRKYIDWLNNLGRFEATGVHALRKISKLSQPDQQIEGLNVLEQIADDVKNMTGGKYAVDSEGNISFTPLQAAGNAAAPVLDLHLTSSTVKSLFGLWYFLKHDAQPGDILMIDEPELNLHPANQRLLARILVRLVNAGLHVVCSTHSDYIVREINSLILLACPHPQRSELMTKYGFIETETLQLNDVQAWYFGENAISPMTIKQDEGIVASTFDQVIKQLNESSDDIYYTYRDEA
ncbi:MAG: hypothetical protein RL748_199 [Pseudomonadota bacterium]